MSSSTEKVVAIQNGDFDNADASIEEYKSVDNFKSMPDECAHPNKLSHCR